MPRITIDGREYEFRKGQTILQVALENGHAIPYYCYHPGLSIVASCRICLAEVWVPNPRNNNALEPIPKLMPTCQTPAAEGNVVYTASPKAIANQRAVMEYLLINHPVDCAVCDQAGECYLQDYSYQFGRSVSRFREQKIKQPKKDLGRHVLLYADRCIMCSRCVRFCREVTGTGELIVQGRAATEQIDIFPGMALENELSANVVDLCPVGALLDKDFLFQQRVWFLHKTPSIDGITASGDNISIEHNDGRIYRIKPRTNPDVNQWWITDEVRYGWKFVHDDARLTMPRIRGEDPFEPSEALIAYESAYAAINAALGKARHVALMVSPMLSCEEAYLLATWVSEIDSNATYAIGPVPRVGEEKRFPGGYTLCAEKAPNARGVRRVLARFTANVLEFEAFLGALRRPRDLDAVIVTGNYPSDWVTPQFADALLAPGRFVALFDTLPGRLVNAANVVLPGATWAEKSGTFENVRGRLQSFHRAIEPIDYCKGESQIALDLIADRQGASPVPYDAQQTRAAMAENHKLTEFLDQVQQPPRPAAVEPDMVLVEL
jgi:NADH-quinone oxidoreductase subunit G